MIMEKVIKNPELLGEYVRVAKWTLKYRIQNTEYLYPIPTTLYLTELDIVIP